jgi:hypothetical protein
MNIIILTFLLFGQVNGTQALKRDEREQVLKQREQLAKIYRQEAFARMRERARTPHYSQPTLINYAQAFAVQQSYGMMFSNNPISNNYYNNYSNNNCYSNYYPRYNYRRY